MTDIFTCHIYPSQVKQILSVNAGEVVMINFTTTRGVQLILSSKSAKSKSSAFSHTHTSQLDNAFNTNSPIQILQKSQRTIHSGCGHCPQLSTPISIFVQPESGNETNMVILLGRLFWFHSPILAGCKDYLLVLSSVSKRPIHSVLKQQSNK